MSTQQRQTIVCLAMLVLIAAWSCVSGVAWAQASATSTERAEASAPALPEPLTREALRDLLARISDAQVRELLIAQLDKEIAAAPVQAADGYIDDLEAEAATLRHAWRQMFAAAPALPTVPLFLAEQLIGDRDASILLLILVGIAIIFAVGYVAEWLFRYFTANLRRQVAQARSQAPLTRISYVMLRLGLDLLGIAIFTAATIATFFLLYHGHVPVRLTVMTLVGAVFVVRLTSLISRFILAPNSTSLRLVQVDDQGARFLDRRIVWLAAVGAGGFMTVDLLVLLGIDSHLAHLLGSIVAAVFVAMLIATIWRGREPVARLIRGGAPKDLPEGAPPAERLRNLLATMWPGLATLYVLVLWAMSEITDLLGYQLAAYAGIWSLVLIVAVPLIDAAIGHGIRAYVETRRGLAGEEAAAYGRVAHRALRIVLIVGAVTIFARLWGVNLFDFRAGGTAERLVSALVDVGLTLLVAYVGWELAKTAIDRRLAVEEGPTGPSEIGGEGGGQGASRLKTLLPLFRKFLMITLAVMVIMLVLSSLGVDIGPLLAGAGVVGLAIGFGAQTLVRDIVSGVFFLMDDAFRLGEYIEVGSIRGTVEHISIRSLRLRHHRGALHTVPFGEIQHLTNHSRDWVIMKLQFRVPYDTDLQKVKKIFKKIGAEMAADPVMGPNLLDPPKSQGVLEMDDSAMIIRCKFMAKPGEQFVIRRELYQRVQKEFEAAGIEFARRQVSVYVPPGAPPEQAAAAAAVAAQEQAEAPRGASARAAE
jgi:moderate conductance mechanosensitive channel